MVESKYKSLKKPIQIGVIGVVHPNILNSYGITNPTSVFEITLEPFLAWIPEYDILY